MALDAHATQAFFKARQETAFEDLPHDNQGPRLNVAIWFLTGVATVFLSLRLYCKRIQRNKLWWDDYILIASFVRTPFPLGTSRRRRTLIDTSILFRLPYLLRHPYSLSVSVSASAYIAGILRIGSPTYMSPTSQASARSSPRPGARPLSQSHCFVCVRGGCAG